MLAGALIGAVAGGVIYAVAAGGNITADKLVVSMAMGAGAGALIGTGVGAPAGLTGFSAIATTIATSAGVGMASSQIGYTVVTGEKLDTHDVAATSLIGGATNAATSLLPPVGYATATQNMAKIGINAAGGVAQYAATTDSWKTEDAVVSGGIGAFAGTVDVLSEGALLARYMPRPKEKVDWRAAIAELRQLHLPYQDVIPDFIRTTGVQLYTDHVACDALNACP
jgi:hypothetical protein